MSTAETIRELAIPVVMISANGLICLALYNRLAAITARLRVFSRERFEIDMRLVEGRSGDDSRSDLQALFAQRLATLDAQCRSILSRAWYVRSALILLLTAIIGLLFVTLLLGLIYTLPQLEPLIMVTFILSVLMIMAGVALAIGELLLYLEPIKAEGLEMNFLTTFAKARRRSRRMRTRRPATSHQLPSPAGKPEI